MKTLKICTGLYPPTESTVFPTETTGVATEMTVFATVSTILWVALMKHHIGTQLWMFSRILRGIRTWKLTLTHYQKMSCATSRPASTNTTENVTLDDVAVMSLPCDCPCNCVPIWTVGDGDCLTCVLSVACFGDNKRNVELRVRIVVEGVYNKPQYLDNDYLSLGLNSLRQQGTFTEQYALFSGQYAHGDLQDVIESVYDNEMLAMCKPHEYMSMWQIWAATNVLARPVRSVFPMRGSDAFHADFNRLCVPYSSQFRRKETVIIMWTPTVINGRIHHFVPLLKK